MDTVQIDIGSFHRCLPIICQYFFGAILVSNKNRANESAIDIKDIVGRINLGDHDTGKLLLTIGLLQSLKKLDCRTLAIWLTIIFIVLAKRYTMSINF